MLLSIAANEQAALHFDDLASALDAGLSLDSLGAKASLGERAVHDLLEQRGVRLTDSESAVLLAAWRAGRISAALRNRAENRRRRAQFARKAWTGLRYPVLLLFMMLAASVVIAAVTHSYLVTITIVIVLLLGVAAAVWLPGRFQNGADAWLRIPWLGGLARNLGELPYLETLHALYGSGLQLLQAHSAAVAAVPVQCVKQRLLVADRILHSGRSLAESLQESLSLHSETRTLLATGEKAGQLENALERALTRRTEVTARSVADIARWTGIIAYATAVAVALLYIASVYAHIANMLH